MIRFQKSKPHNVLRKRANTSFRLPCLLSFCFWNRFQLLPFRVINSIPIHPKKIQFYTWPSQNLFKFGKHKIWNVPSITKEKLAKSAHRFSRYDPPFFCCFNKKGRSHQFSNGHYARTSWPLLMKLVSLERKLRKESNKCIKKCARAI